MSGVALAYSSAMRLSSGFRTGKVRPHGAGATLGSQPPVTPDMTGTSMSTGASTGVVALIGANQHRNEICYSSHSQ